MFCNKCGNELNDKHNFCTNCGAKRKILTQRNKIKSINLEEKIEIKQEIKKGKAYILSAFSGEPTLYEIEITSVNLDNDNVNRGIVLKVTDERLLEQTGGIVQGMSGSPILQNDKIIGAVTHVFVDNPRKGYGIFLETMLEP